MSSVSLDLVKKLRDRTQVGMMDCKKALEDANGDFEAAVESLRKKGAAVAAKRAENVTSHGRIECYVSKDHTLGVLAEMACETDFAANTDAMKLFTIDLAEQVAQNNSESAEKILAEPFVKNTKITMQQHLDELLAKICESIKINRFVRFQVAGNGIVNAYIHPGSNLGVMVELSLDKPAAGKLEELVLVAKDVCMQIAVTNPLCITPADLDQVIVQKERALALEQLQGSNKPAQVIEKIVEGKLTKFFQDACLVYQPFIKNDKMTVQQYIDDSSKRLGCAIAIKQFKRFAIGR